MSEAKKPSPKGTDWTRLLTDPDLVSHLGKLLQTYREVPPEKREAALLQVMREIKQEAVLLRRAKAESPAPASQPAAAAAPEAGASPDAPQIGDREPELGL